MGCWRRSSRTFSLQSLGHLVFRSTRFNDDNTHQSFESSMSSELDQIQSYFLMSSSEIQVIGNWRRSTELLVFRILWHLVLQSRRSFFKTSFVAVFFLAMIFGTSNPWKLETFTQNFWSSDFFGARFFRVFKS